MDRPISEENKGLLRDMFNSEAWSIFESIQKEAISNLRVLATQRTTEVSDRLWYAASAQGREDALYEIKDKAV